MSIPLDNLYHWAESLLPAPAIVYVFRPCGSKKISDCNWLNDYKKLDTDVYKFPGVIAHDQEPLDWKFYNDAEQYLDRWQPWLTNPFTHLRFKYFANFNLKSLIFGESGWIYDQAILIHSEKNSEDLERYQQNGFACVHYWAHAVIARDWYRFAEYDARLNTIVKPQNKFLIYCRDWSHRREYRLKFLELLIQHNLYLDSQTSVMHINSENTHFSQHQFINPDFNLTDSSAIDLITSNKFFSTASADYNSDDFINTEISVVLETVFDGSRIHLTEKTLRPIACGHPFLLAAGPGALEYIRSYGFKTFAPWIDESYDQETIGLKRLEKIIESMKQIQNLQGLELENFRNGIKQIAKFNKMHFFSNEFLSALQSELKNNLNHAYDQVIKTRGKHHMTLTKLLKATFNRSDIDRREMTLFLKQLRQSCQLVQSNPQEGPPA